MEVDEVNRLVRHSSYAEGVNDDNRRRSKVYEALARSDDPLTREIGQQLRDGKIRPGDIFTVRDYREHCAVDIDRDEKRLGKAMSAAKDHLNERLNTQQQDKRG